MWYAGIDWANDHHDVVVLDEAGKRLGKCRVSHTAEGLTQLSTFLKEVGDIAEHPEHLACIIETKQGLLITHLLEAGLPVHPINPKTPLPARQSCPPIAGCASATPLFGCAPPRRGHDPDIPRAQPSEPTLRCGEVSSVGKFALAGSLARAITIKDQIPVSRPIPSFRQSSLSSIPTQTSRWQTDSARHPDTG
ncbi:MAG: IS110 family transposase [Ktedonobacterales bacterium]